MNKTANILLHIYKLKKTKPSYINWKTFNAKQTNIHVPKVLNILKKINKLLIVSIQKQLKLQENALMYTSYKNDIFNTNNSNNTMYCSGVKQIKYNSIFKIKETISIQNKVTVYTTAQQTENTSTQYAIYMLLLNMYINIKNTTTNTVTLPRKRTAYTVLKSPHADKKAREQYMKELFNVRISLKITQLLCNI